MSDGAVGGFSIILWRQGMDIMVGAREGSEQGVGRGAVSKCMCKGHHGACACACGGRDTANQGYTRARRRPVTRSGQNAADARTCRGTAGTASSARASMTNRTAEHPAARTNRARRVPR